MTHLLAILSVASLFLSSFDAYPFSDDLELENLCENDFFSYRNGQVNSFYREPASAVLLPAVNYMIDIFDNCKEPEDRFDDTTTRDKALETKDEYNERIARLYSDESHNNKEWNVYSLAAEYADFEQFIRRLDQLNRKQKDDLPEDYNCLLRFQEAIRRGQELTLSFAPFYRHQFQTSDGHHVRPTKHQQTELLSRALEHMKNDATENQTMLFDGENLSDIYQKEIVWPTKFILDPNKPKTDLHNALEIRYEMVFPFHHDYDPQKPCTPAEKLPRFFPRSPY